MKIFLSKTKMTNLCFLKPCYNNFKNNKISIPICAKFATAIKNTRKKNQETEKDQELYTTSSYLSEQNNDIIRNLKSNLTKETESKQTQLAKKFLIVVPLVFAPFIFHFPSDLVEGLFYSQFFHYSFQIAIKHLFLLNTFNTGIILGYTMSLSDAEKNVDYSKILLRVSLTIASFFICNVLVSYPMNPYLFNGLYLTLMGSSLFITNGMSQLHPLYANYSKMIILLGMTIMLFLINYYYKEWTLKLSEEGKFEETVKFYELSRDKEFAKVMDRIERNLKEIDVKIARRKD